MGREISNLGYLWLPQADFFLPVGFRSAAMAEWSIDEERKYKILKKNSVFV